MSKRCNKCGQGDPHLADTWCLGCTALEALSGELRLAWGQAGTRALAQDLLVSATRQVRALRRLGIAGGGRVRASSPARAEAPPPAPDRPEASKPPPAEPASQEAAAPLRTVKEEEAEDSEYTDATDGPSEAEAAEKKSQPPGLTAVPKARADPREDLPRRRSSGHAERRGEELEGPLSREHSPEKEADYSRASSKENARSRGKEEDTEVPRTASGHHKSPDRESYRRYSPRRDREHSRDEAEHYRAHSRASHHQTERPHDEDHRSRRSRSRRDRGAHHQHRAHHPEEEGGRSRKHKKKNKNKSGKRTHRAGSKHQQYHKAAEDPFRKFHYRPPDSFWDRAPSPP